MYATIGAEPTPRQRAVRAALDPAGRRQDVSDQVDGHDVGQGLDGEATPVTGRQFVAHRQHRGPELGEVQGVERRHCQPGRVEFKRLGGHLPDQPRLQVDVQLVLATHSSAPGAGCRPAPRR